ncbi:hypothetical protein OTU49_010380 [Cherax quadricarinatus]|uniref:Uncharacterized protein n=1 Tax=Cherax quadricarinatus TaxID=27406 RepID=A0AAW0WFZ2_CHEQU
MSPSPQTHGTKTPPAAPTTPTKTPPISAVPPTSTGYSVGGKGEAKKGVTDKTVHLAEAHTRVFDAFSRAFSRQNVQFEKGKRGRCGPDFLTSTLPSSRWTHLTTRSLSSSSAVATSMTTMAALPSSARPLNPLWRL